MRMVLTHFLLATLVTGSLDAGLAFLLGMSISIVVVIDTAGTAVD